MHCVKCGTAIPDGAGFCPSCGTPVSSIAAPTDNASVDQPSSIPRKKGGPGCLKIGLGILGGFVLLGVVGTLLPKPPVSDTKSVGSGASDSASSSEGAQKLPLAVTVKELFGAYESNEASAQGYFGKHQLLVSGRVDKVALDFLNNPEILLRTSNEFMSAHAALAEDAKKEAGNYSPGDSIKLLCEDVSEVASIPMLEDCRPAPQGQKGQPIEWRKR
jgi:hypothetical protein